VGALHQRRLAAQSRVRYSVSRTLDRSTVSTRFTSIKRASDIKVQLRDPETKQPVTVTLQDAIGTRSSSGARTAPAVTRADVELPSNPTSRRSMLTASRRRCTTSSPSSCPGTSTSTRSTPRSLRGTPATPAARWSHVVVEDYQINDVPGFAPSSGVNETRPSAPGSPLTAAKIEFIRIKNSWAATGPTAVHPPRYHDLYMKYLDGPIKACTRTRTTRAAPTTAGRHPLNDFVLRGY